MCTIEIDDCGWWWVITVSVSSPLIASSIVSSTHSSLSFTWRTSSLISLQFWGIPSHPFKGFWHHMSSYWNSEQSPYHRSKNCRFKILWTKSVWESFFLHGVLNVIFCRTFYTHLGQSPGPEWEEEEDKGNVAFFFSIPSLVSRDLSFLQRSSFPVIPFLFSSHWTPLTHVCSQPEEPNVALIRLALRWDKRAYVAYWILSNCVCSDRSSLHYNWPIFTHSNLTLMQCISAL